MYLALVILVAIIAVLLILVVLIQNSKGGGLSSEFGGMGSTQMFGVKKTTDLLEQITWGLAGAIMLFSLASYIMVGDGSEASDSINSINVDRAQNTTLPGGNVAPLPGAATTPASPVPVAPADSAN